MNSKIGNSYILSGLLLALPINTCTVERNTVVATINVGVNPAGIAITPDNHTAYVANNNNYGLVGADNISVLNLKNNTLKQTINDASFNEPYTITINKKGTRAYIANSNSTTITVLKTKTNKVIAVIDGFDGPSGMVITPKGDRAYVNNYGGSEGVGSGNATTVRVVDLKTNTIIEEPIEVDLAPAALAISPDGKFVYVANYVDGNPGTGTLSIIKTSNNQVIGTITGFSGPFAIAIAPNGKYAYVTNFGSNNFAPIGTTVSVVNLRNNTIKRTIDLAIQPSGIAITPDGRSAYVTNFNTLYAGENFTDLTAGQGTVNIIDIDKHEVIAPTIVVGQSPANIALSSNGKYAYITNYQSNTVSVIILR